MLREDEVDDVLDAIRKHFYERLTVWECGFIDNVKAARDDGQKLTPTQRTKLDEIFEKVSNHGRG